MLIYDPTLDAAQKDQAKHAVDELCRLLPIYVDFFPPSLYGALVDILTETVDPDSLGAGVTADEVPLAPFAVIAHDPTTIAWGYTGGVTIWLGSRAFQDSHPMRLPAVLLHELTHVLCGRELDSETVENFMFTFCGAATLQWDDLLDFVSWRFRGRWYRIVKPAQNAKEALIKHSADTTVFTITQKSFGGRGVDQEFSEILKLIPVEA